MRERRSWRRLVQVGLENRAEFERRDRRTTRTIAAGIAATTLSALLLSAAGSYAMLSFTVALRRREIGIRIARGPARRGLAVQPTEALREE